MKRSLFKYFNLLMACVVLLSSTGFGLVEHSCQMRGKKKTMVVAFSDAKTQTGCATDKGAMPDEQTLVKKRNAVRIISSTECRHFVFAESTGSQVC